MATELKKTDVVIIGMGAAGGVAALPLAQAGLDIVGLEAGTWLRAEDFAQTNCATTIEAGRSRCRRQTSRSPLIVPTRRRLTRHACRSTR
jgi:choline dehydrogenase-like flavoprotein